MTCVEGGSITARWVPSQRARLRRPAMRSSASLSRMASRTGCQRCLPCGSKRSPVTSSRAAASMSPVASASCRSMTARWVRAQQRRAAVRSFVCRCKQASEYGRRSRAHEDQRAHRWRKQSSQSALPRDRRDVLGETDRCAFRLAAGGVAPSCRLRRTPSWSLRPRHSLS